MEDRPNGLLCRRSHSIGKGRVLVEEEWDLDHPGCPMIRSPWHAQDPWRYWIRQVIMSDSEYKEVRPTLFEPGPQS